MNKQHARTALTVALLALLAASAEAGQFILKAQSAADTGTICQRYGLTVVRLLHDGPADQTTLVAAPTASAEEDLALKAMVSIDPLVEGFDVDASLTLAESVPSQAAPTAGGLAQSTAAILEAVNGQPALFFGSVVPQGLITQPAALLIRLQEGQAVATGGGIVAVIDTGVDPYHPLLANSLVAGYDFVNNTPGVPTDFGEISQSTAAILERLALPDSVAVLNQSTAAILEQSTAAILESAKLPAAFGHGTMVAGLVHLVAPTALIMPLKAFKADGTAQLSDLAAAIYYAVDNGATVINMSFTLAAKSQALLDAINYAASQNVLCVAAVGNNGQQVTTYPAAWPNVLAVGSTTMDDRRSLFSNYGKVDVSAPGEGLITAYPGSHYAAVWGTSFATALVTGSVALFHQYVPRMSEHDTHEVLEKGPAAPSGMGEARLDVVKALQRLLGGSH